VHDADPRALLGGAGDQAVEALPDARLQQQGRGGLPNLALDLVGVVFLLRAVPRQVTELVDPVR